MAGLALLLDKGFLSEHRSEALVEFGLGRCPSFEVIGVVRVLKTEGIDESLAKPIPDDHLIFAEIERWIGIGQSSGRRYKRVLVGFFPIRNQRAVSNGWYLAWSRSDHHLFLHRSGRRPGSRRWGSPALAQAGAFRGRLCLAERLDVCVIAHNRDRRFRAVRFGHCQITGNPEKEQNKTNENGKKSVHLVSER